MQSTRKAVNPTAILFLLFLMTSQVWAAPQELYLYRVTDLDPGFNKNTAAIAGMVGEVEIDLDSTAVDRVPDRLDIALPDGRELTVKKTRFEVERTFLSWSGQLVDDDGSLGFVHLIDRGDRVTGIVNVGSERFQIVPYERGHRLVHIELEEHVCFFEKANHDWSEGAAQEEWERELDPHISGDRPVSQTGWSSGSKVAQNTGDTKSLTYIDVLAVYPNAFSGTAETDVRQFIDNSVSVANTVFANSNVNARYRLVGKVKLTGADQPPATGLLDGIEWMTAQQVGSEDVDDIGPQEVLDLRDDYAADMVALFIPLSYAEDTACAIANVPQKNGDVRPYIDGTPSRGDFGKRAYTVHRSGCGLNDFTFAHELGHNFGMRHGFDEDTDASVHLFATGRGHNLSKTPWRDIANGTLETDVPGAYTVGYHFTPSVDGYVVGLGGLFNGTKLVKLWDYATGDLLRQNFVDGNNTWVYEEEVFEMVEVQGGRKYTVAAYTNGTGGSVYHDVREFPETSGQVEIHGTTHIAGSARPTNTVTDIMYGQLDVQFVPTASLTSSVLSCIRFSGGDITDEVCNRVPYFSDPNIQVGGYTTGTNTRNNASVARIQAGPYANFRTNNAPVCQNDFLTTPRDTRLSVLRGDLLNNDYDPNGDLLSIASYDYTTAQGGMNDTGHTGGFNYTPPSGFCGTDWFSYTVADRPPGHPAGQTDTCVVYVDVTCSEQVIGEVGSVTNLTHSAQVVSLSRSYSNPIVIAQTLSQNGGDTSVVRVTDVRNDRFTFYVDEAPNRDGPHTTETVSYLVVEAGEWLLSNGSHLRAGKVLMSETVGTSVANQWKTVSYGGTFPTLPGVFSQVQTNSDPSWVKTRHRSVGSSSAQLALEKDEASTVSHGLESVGWIAIEPGSGTWNGHGYVTGQTPNAVTDAWYTLSFGSSMNAPRFFAAIRSYSGGNNSALRYTGLSSTAVQIRVEEDTTLDPETDHISEVVDYLVLSGSGLLTGVPE